MIYSRRNALKVSTRSILGAFHLVIQTDGPSTYRMDC